MEDNPKQYNVYMTAFGAFGNITNNPTMEIVQDIDLTHLQNVDGKCIKLIDKWIVDVDIDSANAALDKIHDVMDEHADNHTQNLILHLGVNAGATRIELERQAVNCTDFGIPDMQGNQPRNEMIDKGEEVCHAYKCKVDIDTVCQKLKDCEHTCGDSEDAGKYLWNYIYYCSMKEFDDFPNFHVIFIHVPEFKTIDKEKQIACVSDFIKQWALTH